MGIVGHRTGSVRFEGGELIARTSNQIARAGIAFCPEERGVFSSLTVEENLLLPPVIKPGGLPLDRIFDLFPNLKERLGSSQGTKLSGGEQQMLAIGRILRTGARLLLLDEPTEGLAPVIIQQIGKTIRALKEQGFTILLVEQNFRFASTVADRYYVMAAPIYNVSPQMGSELIIVVFAVVVIGGMGSILGAIVTGFGLGVIEGLTKVFFPEASNTVIFVIMAIVLLVRPAGLFGRRA